jgi:hypothetical protein
MITPDNQRLIIEFIGAVFIAFVSHYLTKSHYERKRRDELADREFTRRAIAYDKRIREAEDFIDGMEAFIDVYRRFIFGTLYFLLHEDNKEKNLESLMEDVNKSLGDSAMEKDAIGKSASLKILEDKQLLELHKEIEHILLSDGLKLWDILNKIKIDDKIDTSIFADLEILSKAVNRINELLVKMKKRLDRLISEQK